MIVGWRAHVWGIDSANLGQHVLKWKRIEAIETVTDHVKLRSEKFIGQAVTWRTYKGQKAPTIWHIVNHMQGSKKFYSLDTLISLWNMLKLNLI